MNMLSITVPNIYKLFSKLKHSLHLVQNHSNMTLSENCVPFLDLAQHLKCPNLEIQKNNSCQEAFIICFSMSDELSHLICQSMTIFFMFFTAIIH